MIASPLQRAQDVDCVEDVVEDDIVEFLAEIELFGRRGDEPKMRMVGLSNSRQLLADFNPNTFRRLHGGQQMPGLAAQLQHPLPRFDDEPQNPLQLLVKIPVGLNPFVTLFRNTVLKAPAGLTAQPKRLRSPGFLWCGGWHGIN